MKIRHDMITVFVVRPDSSGRSQEFLQLLRVPDSFMGKTWQIVRGGVEKDETYINAALRELREETGLVPSEFFRLGTIETFYTAVQDTIWHSVAFCAMVNREHTVRLNEEHTDFRWIARDQILGQMMWASERALYSDLCRDILDGGSAKTLLRIESTA